MSVSSARAQVSQGIAHKGLLRQRFFARSMKGDSRFARPQVKLRQTAGLVPVGRLTRPEEPELLAQATALERTHLPLSERQCQAQDQHPSSAGPLVKRRRTCGVAIGSRRIRPIRGCLRSHMTLLGESNEVRRRRYDSASWERPPALTTSGMTPPASEPISSWSAGSHTVLVPTTRRSIRSPTTKSP